MSLYTKMMLVRPDMVRDSSVNTSTSSPPPLPPATNPQKAYYETQLLKEKFSPHSSLIQTLTRLHNKAYAVLQDDTIEGSAKLARYNELMTTSSILMKKVKNYMKWEEVDLNPHYPIAPPYDTSSSISDLSVDTWQDAESELSALEEDTSQGMSHIAAPSPVASKSTVSGLETEIRRRVPLSYQKSARNLYKTFVNAGKGKVNWDTDGQLVLGGLPIPGSDIVELLSDAVRPKTRGKTPTGRAQFIKYARRVNPTLRYIRNKAAYSTLKHSPKKTPQSGKGVRQKIVWHTQL